MAIVVLEIDADSPVHDRVEVGDILLSLDHTPLNSFRDLRTILEQWDPGNTLSLQLQRKGTYMELEFLVPETRMLGITSEKVRVSEVNGSTRASEGLMAPGQGAPDKRLAEEQLEALLRIEKAVRKSNSNQFWIQWQILILSLFIFGAPLWLYSCVQSAITR